MRVSPGTMPTTAREEGRESMPFETTSAIMRMATSSQERVLYLICGTGSVSGCSWSLDADRNIS